MESRCHVQFQMSNLYFFPLVLSKYDSIDRVSCCCWQAFDGHSWNFIAGAMTSVLSEISLAPDDRQTLFLALH